MACGKAKLELMQEGQSPRPQLRHEAVAAGAGEPNQTPPLVPLGLFEVEAMWRLEDRP